MNLTMPWKAPTENPVNGATHKLDEIRKALSHEAEHLAQVATQYGREAGSQATKLAQEATDSAASAAHDSVGSAGSLAQSLLKGAAEIGTAIAATGRKTAADLGHDAKAVANDLSRVRITTEPKKTGPDFTSGIALLGGFGAGIALMYFLDPDQGRRRRALLRDQLTKWTRITSESLSGKAKDLGNRASGVAHEARKAVENAMPAAAGQANESDWQPTYSPEYSNGSGVAATDPSTTDTWGEQPQSSQPSRIEIS